MTRIALLSLLVAAAALAQGKGGPKALPALAKAPSLKGSMKDLASGALAKAVDADDATAGFSLRLGHRKDVVYLGAEITDDKVMQGDLATLTLFFPGAGATATGHSFRFGIDGKRTSDPDTLTPEFAQALVEAHVEATEKKLVIKAAIPAMALPRWPSKEALDLEVCLEYADRDEVAQTPVTISNCRQGTMADPVKLPDAFRAQLKLKPPEKVSSIVGAPVGWLGYGVLPQPTWVYANEKVTESTLAQLFGDQVVDAQKAGVNIPRDLEAAGAPVMGVVTGKDPYAVDGQCNAEHELRLILYRVTGRTADKVLDWPASTCQLGRATSISMDEDGSLTLGYTNGAVTTFTWATDHFERTELGSR